MLLGHLRALVASGQCAPDRVRLLTPTRAQATALRDEVGLSLERSTRGPVVMSVAAFAFDLVRQQAEARGEQAPRLRSGADVDQDLSDLLTEHLRTGTGPTWPEHLGPEVRQTETFRTELRELIARLTELGLGPENLRQWSTLHPAWSAVADFLDDYQRVIARSRPHEYDSAELLRLATSLVESGEAHQPGLHTVLVDNLHDTSPATIDLLLALHHRGVRVGVSADPDVAGQTFRGAHPDGAALFAERLGVSVTWLAEVYRHGPLIRALVSDVVGRVGTARLGPQRKAPATGEHPRDAAFAVSSPSPAREAADIARLLRQEHREQGVGYQDMAVVVRRAGSIPFLASALHQHGIPTDTDFRVPLGVHPASRELIGWILLARHPERTDYQQVVSLLTGLYGGFSRRQLRRLGAVLRALEHAEGSELSAHEALVQLVTDGHLPLGLPESWHRPVERVLSVVRELRSLPPSTTADVLASAAWTLWGVEDEWASRATDRERPSTFARECLIQVGALLRTAERYVASHLGVSAEAFFDGVLQAEVTEDVLLPPVEKTGVTIATPASVAGEQYRVVAVAGLNDHVWPNTRIRGTLLGAPLVSRAVRGELEQSVDEQRLVIDDELRMAALAISRATDTVIVSAIESEDEQPSPLFHLLAERAVRVESVVEHTGSSRGLVGEFRRQLVTGGDGAAAALAYLHERGAPGAHPDTWWGLGAASTSTPLFDGEVVPVSPSKISAVEDSALDWFIDRIAPDDLPPVVGVGSLLHYALEHAPSGTREELAELVSTRFSELDFESTWQATAHHRRALDYVVALADYLAWRASSGVSVVATERRFDVELDGARLVGVIDRVERDAEGQLVVVDLKTGKPVSDNQVVDDPQLSAYQLALAEGELSRELESAGRVAGAWLLFVREGKDGKKYRVAAQQALDPEALEQFRDRVGLAAGLMASAQFSGPLINGYGQSAVSIHRWQRVPAVCSD